MACNPINVVTDYGADPSGVSDSKTAIQNAFNAAFGTAAAPHGFANWQSNRPVFFPLGSYKVTGTITVTQVYRGLIFGTGSELVWGGTYPATTTSILKVNGMEESRIERLSLRGGSNFNPPSTPSTGPIGLDLDWDGVSTFGVRLRNNTILRVTSDGCNIGTRIANSGNDGSGNNFFYSHNHNNNYGVYIVGSSATGNLLWSNSMASNSDVAVQCDGGSFTAWGNSISTNHTADVVLNSAIQCLYAAGRTEVSKIANIGTGATLRLVGIGSGSDSGVSLSGTGTVIVDACHFTGGINGTGKLRRRAGSTGAVAGGITVLEDI